MSNKKRIQKKLLQLKKPNFHLDFGRGNSTAVAGFIVGDEMKYLDKSTLDKLISVSCNYTPPFSLWVGVEREINTFKKHQLNFEFKLSPPEPNDVLNILLTENMKESLLYHRLIPEYYRLDFSGLISAGFSPKSAYETLKETYKF